MALEKGQETLFELRGILHQSMGGEEFGQKLHVCVHLFSSLELLIDKLMHNRNCLTCHHFRLSRVQPLQRWSKLARFHHRD